VSVPPIQPAPQVPPLQTYLGNCLPPTIPTPTINLCSSDKETTSCQLTVGTNAPTASDAVHICNCLLTGIQPQLGGSAASWNCKFGPATTSKRQAGSSYVAVFQSASSASLAKVSALIVLVALVLSQ